MPKRLSKPKRPKDINQLAHQLVQESTEQKDERPVSKSEISRVMAEMGRKGGKIGGKRRLDTLTPERRAEIALQAARTRWAKNKPRSTPKPR